MATSRKSFYSSAELKSLWRLCRPCCPRSKCSKQVLASGGDAATGSDSPQPNTPNTLAGCLQSGWSRLPGLLPSSGWEGGSPLREMHLKGGQAISCHTLGGCCFIKCVYVLPLCRGHCRAHVSHWHPSCVMKIVQNELLQARDVPRVRTDTIPAIMKFTF